MADQLCDIVSKLSDSDHVQELVGNTTLYLMVKQKVPQSLLVKYAEQNPSESKDGLAVCLMLEMAELYHTHSKDKGRQPQPRRAPPKATDRGPTFAGTATAAAKPEKGDTKQNSFDCPLCKEKHHVVTCKLWKPASVDERWKMAKEKSLCYKCLCANHMAKHCKKEARKCGIDGCQRTHHRHLHAKVEKSTEVTVSAFGVSKTGKVMPTRVSLRVVPVFVTSSNGQKRRLNAFLDDGCDSTYVRKSVATALGMTKIDRHSLTVSTMTGVAENLQSGTVAITVESLDGRIGARLECRVLDNLCEGLRPQNWSLDKNRWPHLRAIDFPRIEGSDQIDIVIGSDHPELMMSLEEVSGKPGDPVARRTPLGWTCAGTIEMVHPVVG